MHKFLESSVIEITPNAKIFGEFRGDFGNEIPRLEYSFNAVESIKSDSALKSF